MKKLSCLVLKIVVAFQRPLRNSKEQHQAAKKVFKPKIFSDKTHMC